MIEFLLYPLIGVVSGFMAGFFGVGGGLVIVPCLHFMYKTLGYSDEISIPISVGTALACIIINSLSAVSVHQKNKSISWEIFWKLFFGISIGTILGTYILVEINKELFKNIFAGFMFLISMRLFFNIKDRENSKRLAAYITVPVGGGVGVLSAAFGIGGGIFIGPFLRLMGETMKKSVGTAVVCTFPISLIGSTSYVFLGWGQKGLPDYSLGYLNILSFLGIVIFSSFASRFGAQMVQKVNEKVFQTLYALQLVPVFLYWFFA